MKKILLIGCLLCANLQAQVYNFESAASSGGITTTTVQDSTGWKRVGTSTRTLNERVIVGDDGRIAVGTSLATNTGFARIDTLNGQYISFQGRNNSNGASATTEFRAVTDGGGVFHFGVQGTGNTGTYANWMTGDWGFMRSSSAIDGFGFVSGNANARFVFAHGVNQRMIIAPGGVGVGATTEGQASRAKFNVLGRAANDTLAIWSNDGSGIVGDSTVVIDAGGRMGIKTFPSANYGLTVSGGSAANIAAASYEVGNGGSGTFSNTSSGSSISMLGGGAFGGGMRFNAAASGNRTDRSFWFQNALDTLAAFGLGAANKGYYSFGNGIKPQSQNQAIFTIRPAVPVNDTLFMARNDKNATLDSTFMVFANGSAYVGGNNLYLGGHRIRSNATGDSLIFYDGNTMIFAILSDGTTADLVAGTPPTLWRNGPPQEYIWLLRIGVLLLLLLVAFKVYDYAKPRIRKHKTLPGEI